MPGGAQTIELLLAASEPEGNPMADDVLVEQRERILIITINRPEARNAINAEVTNGVAAALDHLDAHKELSIGILTGAGGTFCAGMDLKAFLRGEQVGLPGRGLGGLTERPPAKPLIAAVEGYALAGGFELALACDLIVAAEDAKFGIPEVKRGLMAAPGGALAAALELAERITANAPLSITATKEVIVRSADWTTEDMWRHQQEIVRPIFGSADARESASAFAEKRAPVWRGE